MKKLIILLAAFCQIALVAPFARAQVYLCPGLAQPLRPLGYQQLSVSTTAVALTLPAVGIPRMAVIVVETNTIRYRDDGSDPSATVGTPIPAAGQIVVCGAALSRFKAIRATADGALSINFYGD